MKLFRPFLAGVIFGSTALAADPTAAALAVNSLGLDLHRALAKGSHANLCLSPYSIQNALAMTYAGADGETREEMARVLHYPKNEDSLHASVAALNHALEQLQTDSAKEAAEFQRSGMSQDPITFRVANRLFGQTGFAFRDPFLKLLSGTYNAPLETLDFAKNPAGCAKHINQWVEAQTNRRIQNLIAPGILSPDTRLVLANAIYLKAPWQDPFNERATSEEPFHTGGSQSRNVPTMRNRMHAGYSRRDGYSAISIPYTGGALRFLILLPDTADGLQKMEGKLTPSVLSECAKDRLQDVALHLPKFKLEPPTIPLGATLEGLGLKTAFDHPPGSANFERMTPRRGNDYITISEVLHKTFLAVDEKGTEAAAATAVVARAGSAAVKQPEPIEVKVDRPFFFAIQHQPSGACLFMGRITDPR